jgi:hypothetical protein
MNCTHGSCVVHMSIEKMQAKTGNLHRNMYKNAMPICEHKGKSILTS